ncbi:hypothetical protein LRY65_05780 [Candidatus Woesebacteria bacterium]|nr:hypothetical protein [Candidatus Woesebacteria bacterium]MCD8506763.1 hypothetical protein [Candidatus Woesebacteria bacterium]MCD8527671.1 hypothetical protein [Candidatus Woesebacteria bacterium]MCD8546360.1 hypothetical protein [Candidatus Woesebacteria bacterium]
MWSEWERAQAWNPVFHDEIKARNDGVLTEGACINHGNPNPNLIGIGPDSPLYPKVGSQDETFYPGGDLGIPRLSLRTAFVVMVN